MAIGVLDKTGISNAVPVAAVDIHKEIDESIKQYRVQAVTEMVAASGLCVPCSATVGTASAFATVVNAEAASNLAVADDVAKIVVIPHIAADAGVFPDTVKVAMFDVDAGTINKSEQFVGSAVSTKAFHETSGVCWYAPVVFDNVFMSNTVKFKCELPAAPAAELVVDFNVFVGGDAILLPEMDEYFSYVSLLVQPAADAADGSTAISDYAGSTISLVGTTQVDTASGYPAMNFPATQDRITVPHAAAFNFASQEDFTIDFWFVGPATTALKAMFGHRHNDANNSGWYVGTEAGKVFIFVRVADEFAYPSTYTAFSPASLSSGALHYCKITRSSNSLTIELDGSAGTAVSMGANDIFPNTADLAIGVRSVYEYTSETFSPGSILSLRITNGIVRTGGIPDYKLFPTVGVTP